MFSKSLLASLLLVSAPAALAAPKVWDITVGGAAGLVYTPNQVPKADVGDILSFHFQFKNHTVTQSSFDAPCTPWAGGFDSGFMPVAMDATEFPVYNVTVQNTDPIWIHCQQVGHCGMGMVFAANAPKKGNTFEDFLAAATATAQTTTDTTSTWTDSWSTAYPSATAATGGYYKRNVAKEADAQPERRRWSRVVAKRDAY
ncbi:hypothetical protein FS837_006659 [Tulasnella sp. UAMH 9824]|nr:hypothetical protein FS837_006659 [Tulasnella sp. UAMH 9824]